MCGTAIEDEKKRSREMKVDREVMDILKLCWMVSLLMKTFYPSFSR
jgi:hypothetical protein